MTRARGFSSTGAHRVTPVGGADFFPTPPWAARAGGELIAALDPAAARSWCWEPACGGGHMAHGLGDYFAGVVQSDLYRYGVAHQVYDFLDPDMALAEVAARRDWIVTNPPFAHVEPFIRRAYALAGRGVAMLCRLALLETAARHQLLYVDCPLTVVAPFAERVAMLKGRWDPDGSTAGAYAWFVWLKPHPRDTGAPPLPELRPIPPGTKTRLTRSSDRAFAARVE